MRFYKGFISNIFRYCSLVAILSPITIQKSHAQESNNFFNHDEAKTVFDNDITKNESSRFLLLKPVKEAAKPEIKPAAEVKEVKQEDSEKKDLPLTDSKSIIAKFGDPAGEQPIAAQDTAPEPFKGMMAALNLGDKKLAFEYARKYVRYMDKLDKTAKEASDIQRYAMKRESIIPESSKDEEEFKALRLELNDQLPDKNEKQVNGHRQNMANLDPKVKEFINEAAKAEGIQSEEEIIEEDLQPAAISNQPNPQEIKMRQQLRASFAGKAPVDPKGEIDVYFFINTKDSKSIEMGREFQKFYALNNKNKKMRIVSLTINKEDGDEVGVFRHKTNASYPIANGAVFANQLAVEKTPAVIFVSRNTGQAVNEPGLRNFYYLDELAKYMTGGVK